MLGLNNQVKNALKMHLKYIYFMPSLQQIHLYIELLQVHFRYTLNILHLKTDIIQKSYNPQ